jgi:hypothetical protein
MLTRLGRLMLLLFVSLVVFSPFVLAQVATPTPVSGGPPAEVINWLTSGIVVMVAALAPALTAFVKSVLTKLPSWASPVVNFLVVTLLTTLSGIIVPAGKFSWAATLGLAFVSSLVREVKIAAFPSNG